MEVVEADSVTVTEVVEVVVVAVVLEVQGALVVASAAA